MYVKRHIAHRESKIADYFRKTMKNKLYAIVSLALTFVAAKITGDATAFVLAVVFGVPLFFAKTNVFKY